MGLLNFIKNFFSRRDSLDERVEQIRYVRDRIHNHNRKVSDFKKKVDSQLDSGIYRNDASKYRVANSSSSSSNSSSNSDDSLSLLNPLNPLNPLGILSPINPANPLNMIHHSSGDSIQQDNSPVYHHHNHSDHTPSTQPSYDSPVESHSSVDTSSSTDTSYSSTDTSSSFDSGGTSTDSSSF